MTTYHEKLEALVKEFLVAMVEAGKNPLLAATDDEYGTALPIEPGAKLSPTAARDLHTAICRQKGLTADEIIAEWNRQSPEDLW